MKVAVCSQGDKIDSITDPRFGRCAYFVFVDPDTEEYKAVPNASAGASGGAGIQTAQFLENEGIDTVLVGNVGPNAMSTLGAAGIKVYTGISGTVKDAVSQYKEGKLVLSDGATVRSHSGMGGGRGSSRRG